MLEIKTFCFGPFGTNMYVLSGSQGPVLLVDPACSNAYEQQMVYAYVEQLRAAQPRSVAVLATHGHLDHLWGAAWVCEQWHTQVLLHEADIPMAQAMQQQYELFGIRKAAEPFPIEPLRNPPAIADMQIIHTPGHTPGCVCLYWPEEKVLLSGDTLFRMGYGRTDLPGGDINQLLDSLERLFALPADVRVYPGHDAPTTIGAERR